MDSNDPFDVWGEDSNGDWSPGSESQPSVRLRSASAGDSGDRLILHGQSESEEEPHSDENHSQGTDYDDDEAFDGELSLPGSPSEDFIVEDDDDDDTVEEEDLAPEQDLSEDDLDVEEDNEDSNGAAGAFSLRDIADMYSERNAIADLRRVAGIVLGQNGGFVSESDSDVEVIDDPRQNDPSAIRDVIFPIPNLDSDDDEEERDPEMQPPPRKKANTNLGGETSATSESDKKDEDGYTCTICYETFTNSGEHRISCLKCGHVFGKSCIEKWLKQRGQCPQCNSKATKKDIRILYVKSLMAMDNTELTAAKKELELSQASCSRYQFECTKMRMMIDTQTQQIQRLEQNVEQYKRQFTQSNSLPIASSSSSQLRTVAIPMSPTKSGRKGLSFSLSKMFDIKEGGCRVAAYSEGINMLVVSHELKNSLYPNGCGSIQIVNMLELRQSRSFPLHQKQIRDMEFSKAQNDVLLTVALDKKAVLFNGNSNATVQTFQGEFPLWSCAWDQVQQNHFYVGTSNGQIITYDIRAPGAPVTSFKVAQQNSSPINRIRFVKPAYRNDSSNVTGLLVQKLTSVWFCELVANEETKMHQLPFEGSFVNIDFEPISRHFLVSTRPHGTVQTASHMVCDFRKYYSEPCQTNVVTSNLIQTYQGNQEAQKMCRSMIFSPVEGKTYVCANGNKNVVRLWDVSLPDGGNEILAPVHDTVLDFATCKVNQNKFFGLVTDKRVSIYGFKSQ